MKIQTLINILEQIKQTLGENGQILIAYDGGFNFSPQFITIHPEESEWGTDKNKVYSIILK